MQFKRLLFLGIIFSLPYLFLIPVIPSIDAEMRLNFLNMELSIFDIITREPFFYIELYILEIFFGGGAANIARGLNIFISIFLILILGQKDRLSFLSLFLLIYNPISFFLIFNINPQLLATISIFWVIKNYNNSVIVALLAPLFHLFGLLAIVILLFRKGLVFGPILFFIICLGIFLKPSFVVQASNIIIFLYDFIIFKLIAYTEYSTNIMHAIFTFALVYFSLIIFFVKRSISYRPILLFCSVFILSFLSLDYKFFSRLIFSFEFMLIYEIISTTNFKFKLRRSYG
jgi:hypothetical protein